jgi:hypothetical protein
VRREDQDKINKFSRLHQRELNLEDELKAKHVCVVPRIAGVDEVANTNLRYRRRRRISRISPTSSSLRTKRT